MGCRKFKEHIDCVEPGCTRSFGMKEVTTAAYVSAGQNENNQKSDLELKRVH